MEQRRDLIVLGASAGGLQVLRTLVEGLPADPGATLLLVQHVAPDGPGLLAELLQRSARFPVAFARGGERLEPGRMLVAPPDRHLLVDDGHARLSAGPRENRSRPAIDPLFRSAAVAFGPRVIGVLLSGFSDDGVSGLAAVSACGGLAVVQDPSDAAVAELPRNALDRVQVDHCVPAAALAELLLRLAGERAVAAPPAPERLVAEVRMGLHDAQPTRSAPAGSRTEPEHDPRALGDLAEHSCPDCGGPLRAIDEATGLRFRCVTGHAYTAAALAECFGEETERALWVALRSLEERQRALERLARDERTKGRGSFAERMEREASELHEQVARLRELILAMHPSEPRVGA